VPGEMLKLAEHILDTKAGDFDPDEFKDRYEDALVELIRKKQAQVPARKGEPQVPSRAKVINLMDVLKQSIAEAGKKPRAAAVSRAKSSRKRA
jgi:DNA end-binding protein Ku